LSQKNGINSYQLIFLSQKMGLTDQVEQKLEMGCAILKMFTSSLAFGATSLTMHLLDRRATL